MKQATIRDVAREANVSVASVSRALNGHENVRSDLRQRVFAAVEVLGYVPHAAARSLSMASTEAIGVVVPDLHGEFFSELLRGMDVGASASGRQLLLSTMHADPELAGKALRAMRGRVDGIIVMAPQMKSDDLRRLLPPGLPAVLVICSIDSQIPSIGIDNRLGAAAMVRHLHSIGRRQIVYINGPDRNIDAAERLQGFQEAIGGLAGMEIAALEPGNFTEEAGRDAVARLLDCGKQFDAIFAANDMMALGALQELRRRGVDVPGEIALAGFDDIPLARFLGLSTMQVHMAEIGQSSVELLVATMSEERSGPAEHRRVKPELIVRNSTVEDRA